jgi:hypothetical protein
MAGVAALVFTQLLALGVLAVSCFIFGRAALRRTPFASPLEAASFATGLGMGIIGTALLLLGLAGALHLPLVGALLVLGHAVCYRTWRSSAASLRQVPPRLALGVALLALPAFVLSLYPPSAFDETMYHLPYVKLFAREHAVVLAGDLRFPVFPQLAHAIFAVLYMAFGDVATHVVQLLAALVTAGTIAGWSGALEGRRPGFWGAALWAGNPIVVWYAATAYVDIILTMFVLLSARAIHLWRESGIGRWVVLCAAMAGFAAATKYHGLVFAAAFPALLAVRGRNTARTIMIFAAVLLLALAPVYVRNTILTGNPVFPFLSRVFGVTEWSSPYHRATDARGRVQSLVELPLNAVADPERRGGQPPYSPFLLLALPLALYDAVRRRSVALLTAVMLGYLFLVATGDIRFLLPAAAFFSVLAAARAERLIPQRAPAALSAALVLLLVSPGAVYGAYKLWEKGPVPVTDGERDAWFAEVTPFYPLLDMLNQKHGENYSVYVMYGENAVYFADGRFAGDKIGRARFSRIAPLAADPEKLAATLNDLRIDYLLVDATTFRLPPAPQFVLTARSGSTELYRILPAADAGK